MIDRLAQKISKFVSFEPKIVKIVLLSLKSWIYESMLAVNKAFFLCSIFSLLRSKQGLQSWKILMLVKCAVLLALNQLLNFNINWRIFVNFMSLSS